MTQDPKKPSWLTGGNKQPPPSEPEDNSPPPAAGDDADVPPWLRDDAPPPPPRVKKLTPPPQPQGEGDIPPWLAGGEEPDKPKTFKIGGAELSEEYFAGGDALADSLDTEMTFDSWMAEQEESKREKDIEEEIPEDLLSAIGGSPPSKDEAPKSTGQLPDWFLGLEALDTTEAPEWFVTEEQKPKPAEPLTPTWISDMFEDQEIEPEDELPSADDIGSFFNSIGSGSQDEDEAPTIDWYEQPDTNEDATYSPGDDFFAQLVSGGAPSGSTPQSYAPQTGYDAFGYADEDEAQSGAGDQGAVEIPQNELDAFFTNLASGRGQPVSMDDIEDPELEWVVPPEPDYDEPEEIAPQTHAEPDMPVELAEDSANWLGELENIVASAARPPQTGQLPDLTTPEEIQQAWNAPPVQDDADADEEIFHWPEPSIESELVEEEPVAEADWFSGLSPNDAQIDDAPPQETVLPPPLERSRLTDRLYREPEPEAELPVPVEDDSADWESLVSATLPSEPESLYSSEELDQVEELFARDNLFDDEPAYAAPEPAAEQPYSASLYASEDDEEQVEEFFTGNEDLFADAPAYTPPELADALPNTGDLITSWQDEEKAEAEQAEELIPDEELQAGWMTDDLLAEDEIEPAALQSESDSDFFTLLETDADVNLLDEEQQQRSTERALSEADFLNALELNQPDSALEAAQQDEDLYPSFDFGVEDQAEPAAQSEIDALGQWQSEQPATVSDDEAATYGQRQDQDEELSVEPMEEEDFFASLGMDAETEAEAQPASGLPNTGDLISQWQDEEQAEVEADAPAAQPDDFYASLGIGAEDETLIAPLPNTGDLISQWQDEDQEQPAAALPNTGDLISQWQDEDEAEAEAQPDDFFASLGIDAEAETPATALPNTGDLIGGWQEEQAAEPEEFFSVLDIGTGELSQPDTSSDQEQIYTDWQTEQPVDAETEAQPDDFYASLGLEAEDESQPASALPNTGDLLSQWQDQEQLTEPAAQEDDFFASLGMDTSLDNVEMPTLPNTGELISQWQDEELPETAEAEAGAPAVQPVAESDPFANWDTQAEVPPTPDFYNALDMIEGEQAEEMPDFFADLAAPQEAQAQTFGDVDSYLASLSNEPSVVPETPYAQDAEIDLDALFSDAMMSRDAETAASPAELISGADEDWLAQLQPSVGEVSASAIVRQQEDRPVEELSDRLKKLRQRAEEIPEEAREAEGDSLTSSPFIGGSMGLAQSVSLTPAQEKQVALLKSLVPVDERSQPFRLTAIDATYDSPFMPDLEDTPETTVHPVSKPAKPKPRRRARRRRSLRLRPERFLVAVVLAAAVILPFILPGFRIGSLPPSTFASGSVAQVAFDQIDALQTGDQVLVGVEYGAASAAELDSMTEALLRHIILRGAFPVIISGNPVGLLRSQARIAEINRDAEFLSSISATEPLVQNIDYFVVRYLPGSLIGLRAFSVDTANLLLSDIHGQATSLPLNSLSDFALVTIITDRADDLRSYAEQIAPLTSAPLVSAVSYGAAPLSEPYIHSLGGGLLVGYGDAYTYTDMLETVDARSIAGRSRVIPTPEPVQIIVPFQQEVTPTPRPTRPAVTPTTPPTQAPDVATVISEQPANMRGGPGTEFPVLAAVGNGEEMVVLGFNDDQTWVNVQLRDGREGWISATLLSIQQAQSSVIKQDVVAKRQQVDEGEEPTPTRRSTQAEVTEAVPTETETEAPVTSTPRPTRTPVPSATLTATEAPTEEATPEATPEATMEVAAPVPFTFTLPPPSPGYRDERWYAMNGGIIAAAFIITLGMVANLLRGLLRRGQRA